MAIALRLAAIIRWLHGAVELVDRATLDIDAPSTRDIGPHGWTGRKARRS
jgi:hypothetical protein